MGHDLLARIDKRLEAVGLSESRAPQLAGMSDSTIRNLRRDLAAGKRRSMNTGTLGKLAPVLKTTVQWLLTGAGVEDTLERTVESRDTELSIGDEWRARLSDALEQYGRPHAEIEMTLGLPTGYLINLVEGVENPTLDELDAICVGIGVSFSQLVFGVDVTPRQVEFWRLLQEVNPEAQEAMLKFLREVPRGGKPSTP